MIKIHPVSVTHTSIGNFPLVAEVSPHEIERASNALSDSFFVKMAILRIASDFIKKNKKHAHHCNFLVKLEDDGKVAFYVDKSHSMDQSERDDPELIRLATRNESSILKALIIQFNEFTAKENKCNP